MTKALVIMSPSAGADTRDAVRAALARRFPPARIEYEIHEALPGDSFGAVVRRRLTEGFDLVIAAGGDGTVSAVVDGLVGGSVPLGIIPIGTANLIARELNVPLETDAAASLIAGTPRSRKIDAMRIGGRTYVLIASVGISATVAGGTTRANKNRFGLIAYLGAAILKISHFRPRHLDISVDGNARAYHAVEVAIANCGILAKMLFPKGPDIHVDDGHLDVWIIGTKTFLDYPRYLLRVVTRRPARPRAHFIEAERHIAIRSSVPLPVQADGDVIGTTPVEIEVMPRAASVLVPEKSAAAPELTLARDIFIAKYLTGFGKTGAFRKSPRGGSDT